jgi:hypothetical protein
LWNSKRHLKKSFKMTTHSDTIFIVSF